MVFNPVSAHLEVKALLAETSRVADTPDIAQSVGLGEEEIAAVLQRVPWTRIVTADDQNVMEQLRVRPPETVVLKTSSGYGGHGVVMGSEFENSDTRQRVTEITGATNKLSWRQFCDHVASGKSGLWIAQQRIPGRLVSHRYLSREGAVTEAQSYVDCSIFGGSFEEGHVPGGASRFASDPVVNIGRGGGLMPLILQSEADKLQKGAPYSATS
jgi:hypothetical protein